MILNKFLYKINKKAKIVADTPVGQTEIININEILKQGSSFKQIMCRLATSKVNDIGKRVQYHYEKVGIGMSVYKDDRAELKRLG